MLAPGALDIDDVVWLEEGAEELQGGHLVRVGGRAGGDDLRTGRAFEPVEHLFASLRSRVVVPVAILWDSSLVVPDPLHSASRCSFMVSPVLVYIPQMGEGVTLRHSHAVARGRDCDKPCVVTAARWWEFEDGVRFLGGKFRGGIAQVRG